MPYLGAILSWIASFVGSHVAKTLAWKAFIYGLLMITFPFVVKGIFWGLIKVYLDDANLSGGLRISGMNGSVFNLTGLGAWLAERFKLPEILGMYLGALSAKVYLRMLPLPGFRIVR